MHNTIQSITNKRSNPMVHARYFILLLLTVFVFSSQNSNAQAVADPASLPVYSAAGTITVDGLLNEPSWAANKPHLMFKINGTPTGNSNTPTGHAIVKEPYKDTSVTYVKFLRMGTQLYIGFTSNDKQVCRFDWEGDGMFMKIKNSANEEKEFKMYVGVVNNVPQFVFETNAPAGAGSGVGVAAQGTTIYDSTNVDNGYSCEMVINLDVLGFNASTPSVQILINIFDPDNYSLNVPPWGANGNYAKQWWGSEWGGTLRTLNLLPDIVPVELTSFTAAYVGNSVSLTWNTASETNNAGFEIERSANDGAFVSLGFVKGNGTTSNTSTYAYVDGNILPNTIYSYRLKQIDLNGEYTYSEIVVLGASMPVEFALHQNYPNPFNPATTVSFALPVKAQVSLDVYSLLGEKVMSVVNGSLEAGTHTYQVNASELTSGVYIYSLSAVDAAGHATLLTKKMTLLK